MIDMSVDMSAWHGRIDAEDGDAGRRWHQCIVPVDSSLRAGVALLGAALIRAPWITLLVVASLYLAMMPFAFASYQRV